MYVLLVLISLTTALRYAGLDHNLQGIGSVGTCHTAGWCHLAFCQTLQMTNVSFVTFVLDPADSNSVCIDQTGSLPTKLFMIGQGPDLAWKTSMTCEDIGLCIRSACSANPGEIASFVIGGLCLD